MVLDAARGAAAAQEHGAVSGEQSVRAHDTFDVELEVTEEHLYASGGPTLRYEFELPAFDIFFGIWLRRTGVDVLTPGEEVVMMSEKCDSASGVMRSELPVTAAGVYILRWDNTHSRMRAKQLTYKACVLCPSVRNGERIQRQLLSDDDGAFGTESSSAAAVGADAAALQAELGAAQAQIQAQQAEMSALRSGAEAAGAQLAGVTDRAQQAEAAAACLRQALALAEAARSTKPQPQPQGLAASTPGAALPAVEAAAAHTTQLGGGGESAGFDDIPDFEDIPDVRNPTDRCRLPPAIQGSQCAT
jgi:hypothetical protein|eukprot:SAG25_NODE_1390_length_3142_cov_20.821043_1_plen_303_part_00